MIQLEPGERKTLDSDAEIRRMPTTQEDYRILTEGELLVMNREEIRQLAELAGYTVTDN